MRALFPLTIILILISAVSAQSGDTLFYSYVNNGKIVGKQWVFENEKNSYNYYDEFNDRGRGPAIHGLLRTDEKGTIIFAEYKGVDYYKAEVNERFYVKDGKAFWKNKFENDSAIFKNEVYSDINGPASEYEHIFKMLKQSPSAQLNVLPAGIRNYKQITTTQINSIHKGNEAGLGASAEGQVKPIVLNLIAFSGFGGTPSYIWFTSEGRFFGFVSDWTSLVQRGNEGIVTKLYSIQKQYEDNYYHDLSRNLTERYIQGIAIKNARLFDPEKGLVQENQTVIIHKGLIERTGSSSEIAIPPGYKVIDATNKFLMPGLWGHAFPFFRETRGPFYVGPGCDKHQGYG
jgi:hypothetical protein